MAFGKDPKGLSNVGSFRQTSHAWSDGRKEKKFAKPAAGSGGKIPSWVNEYRPPTDDVDTIRIVQGNYTVEDVDGPVSGLTFWPFTEHYDSRPNSMRRCVCSAGPNSNDKNKRKPCVGCDLFFSSMKTNPSSGKKEKGFMGKRDMVAFTIIDYAKYHKTEQTDSRTGAAKINERTGLPYYSWIKCKKSSEGKGKCDSCVANVESRNGHRLHWAMGSDHYNTLLAHDEVIGKCCSTCGGKNTIRNEAWLCASCGEAIIDNDSQLSKKEIDAVVYAPVTCKQCKHEGFLTEFISCTNCTPVGQSPKRATIFDVDIQLQRISPADGSNRTTLSIVGFSDPRAIDKAVAEHAKPEDLSTIYAPTPLDIQGTLFSVPVQREPVTAAKPYSAA